MKVLILSGGISNEREVSFRSGQAIADALDELGYAYTQADPASQDFDLEQLVKDVDVVFISLHGEGGEDGIIQTQLEDLGVPFTGSGSKASKICWNKWNYKELLRNNNLPASEGEIITDSTDEDLGEDRHERFDSPFVLKPNRGGSSLDTLIVRHPTEKDYWAVEKLLEKYPAGMLFEPLVDGIELTVGVFDEKPLPVIEIVPPEGLEFDYENKYNGATQELCPPKNVPQNIQQEAQELALKIHKLTGCQHMSRTDIMLDKSNKFHVLETNTIPGHTSQSLLPKMLKEAGMSMPEFVKRLIELALSK